MLEEKKMIQNGLYINSHIFASKYLNYCFRFIALKLLSIYHQIRYYNEENVYLYKIELYAIKFRTHKYNV